MHSGEIAKSIIGLTIEEIKQDIEGLAESTVTPVQSAALDLQESAQSAVGQVMDAVAAALDTLTQNGSDDQMRGYANETVGKTKVAVALAAQSPEFLVAGIAQQAIGEAQKFVGNAKSTADPQE